MCLVQSLSVFGAWRSNVESVWRSSLGLRVLECKPKSVALPSTRRGAGSGVPKGSHEKSSNFKPASRAPKAMKMRPKATQNHQRLTLKSTEFQLLCKVGFCNPLTPNACFYSPRSPDSDPQIVKKMTWKQARTKDSYFRKKYQTNFQNRVPKSTWNQ